MRNTLPTLIERELQERGWSAREFGRRVGISHAHAARIVNGEVKPSLNLCNEIAEVLDTSPQEIMSRAGILPPVPEDDQDRDTMLWLWDSLSDDRKAAALDAIRGIVNGEKQRETERESTPTGKQRARKERIV